MKVLLTSTPQPASAILPNRLQSFSKLLNVLGGHKSILGIQPPYGLMYLSAYLRRDGHDVILVDGLLTPAEDILARITREQPDVVGISTVSLNWHVAKDLARSIRTLLPHVKLAVGGAHVNAVQGKALEDGVDFDFAFYGDAEESFRAVVAALAAREVPAPRDGFAWRDGHRVVAAERSAILRDIDAMLLPDREQLGFSAYRPSPQSYRKLPFAAVFGSRGCPGQCTFCHTEVRTRIRSAANIVAEIEWLQQRHGIREVLFYDDNFTLRGERVFELCNLMEERGIKLSWAASARVDTVNPAMLAAMRRAGCWRLLLGIESGSQRILDRVQKRITLAQIRDAVTMIRAAGIQTYGMFIFGFPSETYAEGLQTIAFMKSLDLDFVNVAALTPFPGTAIYEEVRDEPGFGGLDHMNMYDVAYVPNTMQEAQLEDLLRRGMREFYLRLPYLGRQLRNIRTPSDLLRYARGAAVVLLR